MCQRFRFQNEPKIKLHTNSRAGFGLDTFLNGIPVVLFLDGNKLSFNE